MKEYTYPNTQVLSSVGNKLVVGQIYDYKEDGIIGECRFVEDTSDDKYFNWKFQWTIHPFNPKEDGTDFEVSWTKDDEYRECYFSGNTHILPRGSYCFPRRPLTRS